MKQNQNRKPDKNPKQNRKQKQQTNTLKNMMWMFKVVWRHTPGYIFWMIFEGVVWGFNHSIGILYIELLFDSLDGGIGFEHTAKIILAYAVYLLLFNIFHEIYWTIYNPRIQKRLSIALNSELFRQAVRLDLARYDDPEFYNDFVWSMEKSLSHIIGTMEDTGKLINRLIASVTLVSLLLSVNVVMAVVIVAVSIIMFFLQRYGNRINKEFFEEMNPLEREGSYVMRIFRLPDWAKELRTSDIGGILLGKYRKYFEGRKEITLKYSNRYIIFYSTINIVNIVAEVGMIVFMLYQVMVAHSVLLGGFAIALNAYRKMSWQIGDLVNRVMNYHAHSLFIDKLITFLDCKPEIVDGDSSAEGLESLTIKGVSFAYGSGDKAKTVLEDIDMTIKRGEKIAIVGYNGAGKTTLTKLLMRLYDPTGGEICYNGKPLSAYKLDSLRGHIAAVFQDYRIFAATLGENVVGGHYDASMEPAVRAALDASAFTDKLDELPKGIDTVLTREFDDEGTQLSGGEAQKVAITRAFYKQADLIILDEPSSALDPDAEYALNRAISDYAKDKAIVFISHRLSTTRGADRIYMFDNGRIIESGSHDELIARGGKYAEMFNLQAEHYKKKIAAEV